MTDVAPDAQRLRISTTLAASIAAAGGSALLAIALHAVVGTAAYAWVLTALITAAAIAPVAIDLRVRKLPNRWVAPIAAAGAAQAFAIAYATVDPWRVFWPVIVASIVAAFYIALGLAGMFGLGDAKFAAALSITVAIYAGPLALYLIPIAMLLGGLWRAVLAAAGRGKRPRAHGPAIAIAAVAILVTTIALQQAAGALQ
ncbi:leader peptidase (prepilin peptidase)/N-methyltransferase [Curtobacterium sp. PhB130]|uniref:prepilin peptidase n=1 Tax=unclassified Curtobacterium TaxID=257496 RepID=UPI000F4D1B63|nr:MULTISPECIES: prepilin peptidase [unclassified Curtobacterium]ROS71885.1 leader peptidase (prepilin peptidase)/N-methyltransferase [Curtobacterium sp. PhB130]TCK58276.1 leader peptidase (prepilin peptidase)/N-methyltransferase [Curtobacterium sp. PhB136]